jgi:hypothetical protein
MSAHELVAVSAGPRQARDKTSDWTAASTFSEDLGVPRMKMHATGMFSLSFPAYQAIKAINKSGLDQIKKSPAHYQHFISTPDEPTDAMLFGQAAHAAVFEPEELFRRFYARPEGIDGRTTGGKATLSELASRNAGKIMLKAEEWMALEGMMKSVRTNSLVSQLIAGGKAEQSAVCHDAETGVLCKARPDYMGKDGVLLDLKTTESVDFFNFQRSVRTFRYHVQAAWYLDTVNAAMGANLFSRFILIAIEKKAPYGIIPYELDPEAIRLGRIEARANLKTYAECLKANTWPGYSEQILSMPIPIYE